MRWGYARRAGAFVATVAVALAACGVGSLWRSDTAATSVIPVRKKAWEDTFGGRTAAKAHLAARLAAWPTRLTVDRSELPRDDRAFLWQLARDTWRGIDGMVDVETGLPIDHVRFEGGSLDPATADIGDYTSTTNIGLYLASVVAARDLGFVSDDGARARVHAVLGTLRRLQSYHGFYFNFYDTVSLERTSTFVSFIDSSWLMAGLLVARQGMPELAGEIDRLMAPRNLGIFYDPKLDLMSHGYDVARRRASVYHYGAFYTEARLGSLIAIGRGDAPARHWFEMARVFPVERLDEYHRAERATRPEADVVSSHYYEWQGVRFVPSWGGSMFEALMPSIFLDEEAWAPGSLGANGIAHVEVHRRFAEHVLGYPVWGMSPCMTANGHYGEFGVPPLGVRGYATGPVTSHAAALALLAAPGTAEHNLRELVDRYDLYGDFGLYDAVDPPSGVVTHAYLTLDQTMTFLALADHVGGNAVRRRFMASPVVQHAMALIGAERNERFFD